MKSFVQVLILSILLYLPNTFAQDVLARKNLSCSFKGTDVLFINGILTAKEESFAAIQQLSKMKLDFLDKQAFNNPAIKSVGFQDSYNYSAGITTTHLDLFESIAQKLRVLTGLNISQTYSFVYYVLTSPIRFSEAFVAKALGISMESARLLIKLTPLEIPDTLIKDYVNRQLSQLQSDTLDAKEKMALSLLGNKKLILVTHSQGNLFANDIMTDYYNGEVLNAQSTPATFSKFKSVFANVNVAPPAFPVAENYFIVLNDEDFIRYTFNLSYSTFPFFLDPVLLRDSRGILDHYIDHGFLTTYLNIHEIPSLTLDPTSLPQLRKHTLQTIVDAASSLESNCPIAKIKYAIDSSNKLKVVFDATDPLDSDLRGVVYDWDFGDGTKAKGDFKIIEHTFPNENTYEVKLRITDEIETDFEEPARSNVIVFLESQTSQGCQYVYDSIKHPGRFHRNPDGSQGGFVQSGATVDSSVTLSRNVEVCGSSRLIGSTSIKSGFSTNHSYILNSTIEDSYIETVNVLIEDSRIKTVTISSLQSGSRFIMKDSIVERSFFSDFGTLEMSGAGNIGTEMYNIHFSGWYFSAFRFQSGNQQITAMFSQFGSLEYYPEASWPVKFGGSGLP